MRRKFTITFEKRYKSGEDAFTYRQVSNAYILKTLIDMQYRYDFDIISTELKDCFHKSRIKIKCRKVDKNKIFSAFCIKLSGNIENVSF